MQLKAVVAVQCLSLMLDMELQLKGDDVWKNGEGMDTVTEHIYIAIIYEAVHAYSPDHLISKQVSCMYKSLKKSFNVMWDF